MKNNKWKLTVYEIAVKWRLIFYVIAALIVLIPISIVLVTDKAFSSFYSSIFVNVATAFLLMGRILSAFKKAMEDTSFPWTSIGSIIGFSVVLIWGLLI